MRRVSEHRFLKRAVCLAAAFLLMAQTAAVPGFAEDASLQGPDSVSAAEGPAEGLSESTADPEEGARDENTGEADTDAPDPEGEETEEEAAPMTGEEVADSIRTVILAASDLDNANDSGMERLQDIIEETREGYGALPEEQQEILAESIQAFENACVAVDVYETAVQQVEETGTVNQDWGALENSWRYINGQPVSEALMAVDREENALPEEEPEKEKKEDEKSRGVSALMPKSAAAPGSTDTGRKTETDETAKTGRDTDAETDADDPTAPSRGPVTYGFSGIAQAVSFRGASAAGFPVGYTAMAWMEEGKSDIVYLTADAESHLGVDISEWQGTINWEQARADGIEFAIIRCGYSSPSAGGRVDNFWAYNVAECERLGIPYGVYLYSHATDLSMADAEAQQVLQLLKGHKPTLPVYIDIEDYRQSPLGAAALSALASRFCQRISEAGYSAGLYSSRSWYNAYFSAFAAEPGWYHWVAEWGAPCAYGGRYEMWQFTSEGTVSGISGNVDMDYWYLPLTSQKTGSYVTPQEGLYYISSSLNSGMVLDVDGASRSSGANIALQKKASKVSQIFRIEHAGGGYCRILNYNSGMAVDVCGGSTDNSANIRQYTPNGTDAQLWRFWKNTDGTFTIFNKKSGKAVDLAGARTAAGTNIAQYTYNGTGAQKFILEKTTAPKPVPPKRKTEIAVNGVTGMGGLWTITSAVQTGLAIDVCGASKNSGANIHLYYSNKTAAQQFRFISKGGGYYEIVNAGSGMAVDVEKGAKTDNANIRQYTRNGTDAQIWRLVKYKDGTYGLINKKSGKALTVQSSRIRSGTNILQYTETGADGQRFRLNKVQAPPKPEYEGTWIIACASDRSLVWDISSASRDKGGNLQLYSRNNTAAQKFRITDAGNGYYEIVNVNSGMAVDVKGAGRDNGVNIQQYTRNRTAAQQWKIRKNADGTLTFLNRNSGRAADVKSGSLRNRANIQQYADNGTKAQKFVLIKA